MRGRGALGAQACRLESLGAWSRAHGTRPAPCGLKQLLLVSCLAFHSSDKLRAAWCLLDADVTLSPPACSFAGHAGHTRHASRVMLTTAWHDVTRAVLCCDVLQVLVNPVYMDDHVGVLEEEVKAGLVPLPTLPQYKQVCHTCNAAAHREWDLRRQCFLLLHCSPHKLHAWEAC